MEEDKTPDIDYPSLRKRLAEALKRGDALEIGDNGDVTGSSPVRIIVEAENVEQCQPVEDSESLAVADKGTSQEEVSVSDAEDQDEAEPTDEDEKPQRQWYKEDPDLLAGEVAAMERFFPNFELCDYDDPSSVWDGCLCWRGKLRPGVYENTEWDVIALYRPDHPAAIMGSTVMVYLVSPSIEEVYEQLKLPKGQKLENVIYYADGCCFLNTIHACDVLVGREVGSAVTSAAQILARTVKWLTACELVLSGDLEFEFFNRPIDVER